ncbi:MAG TPA: cytochrome c [Vicinamibacteria bacterium]|nr:cytochrome c [Vicinamibacteria bacterium]
MREMRSLVVAFVGLLVVGVFAQASEQRVTFTKDIAPIFQQKCESCHRDGSIAPMSLVSYEEIRPWARAIEEAVVSRYMPPWHIDKTVGIQEFKNDRSLSDDQVATIVKWVDSGAPKGDPNDLPPPVSWPEHDGWMFAPLFDEPDLIIESPAYTMPAQAQDVWYRPVVETGLTEPRWVRAIEIRPDPVEGRRITHHALARLQQEEPQTDRTNDAEDIGPGLFMEWAVGKQGELMRPNSGKLMLPGSKIAWDIHYHAVGEEITSQAQLAIYFYPEGETPKYRQVLGLFHAINGGSKGLDIPPNTVSVHQGFHVMKQAGRVENYQPHMHLRGKAMSMEAVLPNGERRILSHVDNFQFNWHNNYVYADHVAPLLPRGTILNFTAWHDNTAANRSNPDPTQWVGWGDRTVDEMAHAWVNITYMSDEDYETELEARKNMPPTATDLQP